MCVFSLLRSLLDEALSREEFFHAAISMHLLDYVAAADQLPLHVQLREGGPVRPLLHRLSQLLVGKNVHVLVVVNAVELEDLDDIVGETAPGHLLRALHEEDDIVALHPLTELRIKGCLIHGRLLLLRLEIRMRLLPIIVVVIMVVLVSIVMEESGLVWHDDSLRSLKEEHVLGGPAGAKGRLVESQNSLHYLIHF